jgi:hypothetical protein
MDSSVVAPQGEAVSLNCGHQRPNVNPPDDTQVWIPSGVILTEVGEMSVRMPLCPPPWPQL